MSLLGIIGDMEMYLRLQSYCAHLYYTRKQMYEWRFYFVITRDLEAMCTIVRKHYGHFAREVTIMQVGFERSEITLDIPHEGLVTKEGSKIIPFSPPTISREDVDKYKPGRRIPQCELLVQWEREDQRPAHLRHKVDLIGAKPPFNYIYLILNPAMEVPPQHSGKLHSTPELGDLMTLVAAVIPGKWREVALGLGLDSADISRIEASVPTHQSTPCYLAVFDTWKKKGTKDYTWDTLLKALRTPLVDESILASTIEVETSPMELGVAGGKRMQLEGSEQESVESSLSALKLSDDSPLTVKLGAETMEQKKTEHATKERTEEIAVKRSEYNPVPSLLQLYHLFVNLRAKALNAAMQLDVRDFQDFLAGLPVFTTVEKCKFFDRMTLYSFTTMAKLFHYLDDFWDYINCDLLQQVVNKIGDSELSDAMEEYCTKLMQTKGETTVQQFAFQVCNQRQLQVVRSGEIFTKVLIRLHARLNEYTLHDAERLRRRFLSIYSLTSYSVAFCNVFEGTVVIKLWLRSECSPLTIQCEKLSSFVSRNHVLQILVDGIPIQLSGVTKVEVNPGPSSLSQGYAPPHSYHHYPEISNQLPVGPAHQPTYHQPSHPGYPPPSHPGCLLPSYPEYPTPSHPGYPHPGHQYPPQHVCHYRNPPPTQLPPTDGSQHSGFTPCQYTGAQVQEPSCQVQPQQPVTLPQLIRFKTRSGSINILERIGRHYQELGVLLLEDATGEVTQAIIEQHHEDATKINFQIFQKWIQGKGKLPVEWSTLVEVLNDIRLVQLANEIEQNLK